MVTRIISLLLIVFILLAGCAPAATPTQTVTPSSGLATAEPSPTTTQVPVPPTATTVPLTYPLVDTGQGKCYDNNVEIPCPSSGAFFGQDAQYTGLVAAYTKNANGTVTDKNTGLTWQQTPDINGDGKINAADKLTYSAAGSHCKNLSLAGLTDWRLPDIKTLASLLDFRGTAPSLAGGETSLVPFLDAAYFGFAYGDPAAGERTSDAQFASSTTYVDTNTNDGGKDFGVNFADGLIKGYGLITPGGLEMKFFVLCVHDNSAYGANHFVDNGDDTISDQATGLVWQKADNAKGVNWQDALAYCETLSLAGADDWRLPDARSLQSLVDYTRSPATSSSAAINALFSATAIKNEAQKADYPYYWSSTTQAGSNGKGVNAVYLAFGRGMGTLNSAWADSNGAGSQRSDPKSGDLSAFPGGRGPQGDAVRILNYVRCVRGGNVKATPAGDPTSTRPAIPVQGPAGQSTPGIPAINPPSQQQIDACTAKNVGDVCHYDTLIGPIYGTCQQFVFPGFQAVACIPNLP